MIRIPRYPAIEEALLIKRALIIVAVILAALALRPGYEIGVGLGFWQPFTRPPGVSAQARYVTAWTRSAWFDCSFDRLRNMDNCWAWGDTGAVIAYGKYRLDGENRAATSVELRPSTVQVFPGRPELSWIYLCGEQGIFSKTLVPVNDSGQPLERFEVRIGYPSR